MKSGITQKRIKDILHYDPESGIWTWLIDKPGVLNSGIAGYVDTNGYRQIGIDREVYPSGRLAWLYMNGYFPEHEIDHKNRIKHDDRWKNLRHVSHQCNSRNRRNFKNNTSGVKGVYWAKEKGKWYSQIKVHGKTFHIGYHSDKNEAVLHRLAAEQCLDWSDCDSSSPAYLYAVRNRLIVRDNA